MKLPQTSLEANHLPVMIKEVIKLCSPYIGGNFMDCTFGGGGYSRELLKHKNTKIIALDRDSNVIQIANQIKKNYKLRFRFFNKKFSNLDQITKIKYDAIIFDLGLSSIQLDNLSRGFSFKSKSELNMSMGLTSTKAKEVLNTLSEDKLKKIIKHFGEEKDASKIAHNITKERNIKELRTTDQLANIIKNSKKKNYEKIDKSTKTFQAIRIFVNKEITELIEGIINATKILKPGGKLIVISFHSIEDKIVKYLFKNYSRNQSRTNKYLPDIKLKNTILFENYRNKIIKASKKEVKNNPRSRSAKLRYAIRSSEQFKDPLELRLKFKHLTNLER